MVSSLKGESSLKVDGEDYTLVFDIYALSALEEKLGMSAGDIIGKLTQSPPLKLIAAVLWAGLRERHPKVTEDEAMAFIPHLGTIVNATMLCIKSIASVFPSSTEDGGDESPPETAAPGTGSASSGPGAASASVRRTPSGSKPRSSSR